MSNEFTLEQETAIEIASKEYISHLDSEYKEHALEDYEAGMREVLSNPSTYLSPAAANHFYQVCTCPILKDTCPIHGQPPTGTLTTSSTEMISSPAAVHDGEGKEGDDALRDELAKKEGSPYHDTSEARVMAFKHGWDAHKEQISDDWMYQAKALSAIKKGLESSLMEALGRIEQLQTQLSSPNERKEEQKQAHGETTLTEDQVSKLFPSLTNEDLKRQQYEEAIQKKNTLELGKDPLI